MLKDLLILLFSAGEEIDRKAKEFREKREERFRDFSERLKRDDGFDGFCSDEVRRARERLAGITDRIGLASKRDVDDLRCLLKEVNDKQDRLLGERGEKS